MITKSVGLNCSNNESMADLSTVSNCDRQPSDSSSSEETPPDHPPVQQQQQQPPIVLDTNYIESKIKTLLNQEEEADVDESGPSTSKEEEDDEEEQTDESKNCGRSTLLSGILTAEDSCNAVDNKISSGESSSKAEHDIPPSEELSFNGKIKPLSSLVVAADEGHSSSQQCELTDATKGFESTTSTKKSNEKVRKDKLNESFEILTKENSSLMHYKNEKSPDLFADDDDDDDANASEEEDLKSECEDTVEEDIATVTNASAIVDPVLRAEKIILKRLQASLSGVLPPPSVTYSSIDVGRILTLYRENQDRFVYRADSTLSQPTTTDSETKEEPASCCLSKPTHTTEQLTELQWPDVLKSKAHGLHYNRSTTTEKIELLGLKYIDRYIGAETSSTCSTTRSPVSSAKKRNLRLKMINQSPGSRLSHLARRRAAFSSANLLNATVGTTQLSIASSSASSTSTSQPNPFRLCNRQILLDPKKSDNRRKNKGRTPKRRTPGRRKTPRRKTPGSSAKKRALLSLPVAKQQPSRETSKRALFQSPANEAAKKEPKAASTTSSSSISRAVASKVQKSKRALFSPPKRALVRSSSSSSTGNVLSKDSSRSAAAESSGVRNLSTGESVSLDDRCSGKRKRHPEDEEDAVVGSRSGKLPRMESIREEDLTPRSLKLARSQSFCVGSQNSNAKSATESSLCGKSLFRANSEVVFPNSVSRPVTMLTENHKKKLLWAVSQALQSKQISVKHEHFKQYASNLARVVKRLFLEFNDQTHSSTSEKLLRLATKHVFEVIQGRSVDDIYLREKTRIMNARNSSFKPQGYIAPEEYEQRKQLMMMRRSASTSVLISDSSLLEGTSSSQQQQQQQQSMLSLSQSSFLSQSSEFLSQLSQSAAADPSGSSTILRENIDSEQRHKSSAQKHQHQHLVSFSGKDQKNVSPYADSSKTTSSSTTSSSHAKAKLLVGGAAAAAAVVVASSILKAKRQISFE